MQEDSTIREEVLAELRWDPAISHQRIGAAVKSGVVTLTGYVPSYAEKVAADRAAERVAGVRAVVQQMEVRLPTATEVSDQALASRAATALEWASLVPEDSVKPKVEGGWITLEGTVKYGFQRIAGEKAVRNLAGLLGLTNDIRVEPPIVSPLTIRSDIEAALRRHAEVDASEIMVETSDGTVTLRGAVHSWPERRAAEWAAWNAPGVKHVEDQLAVIAG
jgi:osmotically-inducible protein OsmY